MLGWDLAFEKQCVAHTTGLVNALQSNDRVCAWQSLLEMVAPHIEAWAQQSWMLKRYRINSEDDARTVLLGVLERMQAKDYANLRAFLASAADPSPDPGPHAADAERLVWAARYDELEHEDPATGEPATGEPGTPFRAWLITLVRFCAADHVRRRVGWALPRPGAPSSKRDVGTDAQRLTDLAPSGTRPPVTDYIRLRRFIADVEAFAAGFPEDMQQALKAWLTGHNFKEMAAQGIAASPQAAEKLVKAAKSRLREHFRG